MRLDDPFPAGTVLDEGEGSADVEFAVPENYPFLDGHFPENPLVPAVAQIAWFVSIVEALRGEVLGAYRLSRFKFVRPIRPNDFVRVSVSFSGGKYKVQITVAGTVCSSGGLMIGEGGNV